MFGLFSTRLRQPQVWLVRCDGSPWAKAIVLGAPKVPWHSVLGPFRSEIDAEQTADHLNAEREQALFYDDDAKYAEPDGTTDGDGEEWKQAGE